MSLADNNLFIYIIIREVNDGARKYHHSHMYSSGETIFWKVVAIQSSKRETGFSERGIQKIPVGGDGSHNSITTEDQHYNQLTYKLCVGIICSHQISIYLQWTQVLEVMVIYVIAIV